MGGVVTLGMYTGDITPAGMETVSPARRLAMLTPIVEQLNAILVIVVGGGMDYAAMVEVEIITVFSPV